MAAAAHRHRPSGTPASSASPSSSTTQPLPACTLPLTNVSEPIDTDVICGRGGAAQRHPGNVNYRNLVNSNKPFYTTCPKPEKLKISRSIVAAIREVNGRFLERDRTGLWYDIGDKKAIEKTSQALREGQPKLLKKIMELENQRMKAEQVDAGRGAPSVPASSTAGSRHLGGMDDHDPNLIAAAAGMPSPLLSGQSPAISMQAMGEFPLNPDQAQQLHYQPQHRRRSQHEQQNRPSLSFSVGSAATAATVPMANTTQNADAATLAANALAQAAMTRPNNVQWTKTGTPYVTVGSNGQAGDDLVLSEGSYRNLISNAQGGYGQMQQMQAPGLQHQGLSYNMESIEPEPLPEVMPPFEQSPMIYATGNIGKGTGQFGGVAQMTKHVRDETLTHSNVTQQKKQPSGRPCRRDSLKAFRPPSFRTRALAQDLAGQQHSGVEGGEAAVPGEGNVSNVSLMSTFSGIGDSIQSLTMLVSDKDLGSGDVLPQAAQHQQAYPSQPPVPQPLGPVSIWDANESTKDLAELVARNIAVPQDKLMAYMADEGASNPSHEAAEAAAAAKAQATSSVGGSVASKRRMFASLKSRRPSLVSPKGASDSAAGTLSSISSGSGVGRISSAPGSGKVPSSAAPRLSDVWKSAELRAAGAADIAARVAGGLPAAAPSSMAPDSRRSMASTDMSFVSSCFSKASGVSMMSMMSDLSMLSIDADGAATAGTAPAPSLEDDGFGDDYWGATGGMGVSPKEGRNLRIDEEGGGSEEDYDGVS